jgi:hypothetical protein
MRLTSPWTTILTLLSGVLVTALPEPSAEAFGMSFIADNIITRDIAIIGGGASGTYAAIRLRELNQSVVVIERKDRLGGHTETYTDPTTQTHIELGVLEWHNTDLVKNFFARFNVSLTQAGEGGGSGLPDFVDFKTGKIVPGYIPSDPSAALGAYAAQVARYPFVETGFNLPDPVPADLLLPFGQFITKYNISAAANIIFNFNQGAGDFLATPTLYIMKLLCLSVLQGIQTGFLTTADHDNSVLYEKAQAFLVAANSVILNSYIIAAIRDNGGVKIAILTPTGPKLILAKKVLITMPPSLQNLAPFNLDSTEQNIFGKFAKSGYYTGLIKNSGIPDTVDIQNIGANTPFHIPQLPGLYSIDPTAVPGLHQFLYGSPTVLSDDAVKNDILASVKNLKTAGTLNTTTPDFVAFSSHSPFLMSVTSDEIKNGFYKKLNGLQGYRKTFYTGAAFHTHDSSLLWEFTEALLPKIVA